MRSRKARKLWLVGMQRPKSEGKGRRRNFLQLLWLLPAVLGGGSCAYPPPAGVLSPPDMVVENLPAADATPKAKSPAQEFQPERVANPRPIQPPAEGDELARIEDLQRRGVITEQEAQKLKQRLQDQGQPEARPGKGPGPLQEKEPKPLWELSPKERALQLLN